jgi:hypothetical protein
MTVKPQEMVDDEEASKSEATAATANKLPDADAALLCEERRKGAAPSL